MTLRQAQDRPDDKDAPLETVWQGKYISALKRGRWEYVSRTGSTNAVVILAEHEGKVILIEQYRVPVGGICLELPAGLVGDEDEGGGNDHEEIEVFLVAREDIPDFIAQRRAAGSAVDVKLLLFANY